jgi:hypothetical protein
VAPAERARINAHRPVARRLGLRHGPVEQLVEHRGPVFRGEPVLRGLKVRIAGAAPPHVATRLAFFGLDLCIGFAG